MRITYLFGNGLDLSFGLNTSYYDFYKFLKEKAEKDEKLKNNFIYNQLIKDIENHKEDLWMNYESRLGTLTSQVSIEDIPKFNVDKIELDLYLKNHLINEEKKLFLDNNKIPKILEKSFIQITKCFKEEKDSKKIKTLLEKNGSSNLYIDAISFNYTKTVSLLWINNSNWNNNFKINNCPFSGYYCSLGDAFYVHGTLTDGRMIIGVDNNSQISNDKICDNQQIHQALLKSELLNMSGQLHLEKFKDMIYNSEIICLYGLSIGCTDSYYWKIIKLKLLNSNSLLIIYRYKANFDYRHIFYTNNLIEETKKIFFENSDASEDEIKKINERIIVEINRKLFCL